MTLSSRPAKTHRLCNAVEDILRSRGRAMHYSELADAVFSRLGIPREPPVRLNTVLHDDRSGRFQRTARGTWDLAPPTPPRAGQTPGATDGRR